MPEMTPLEAAEILERPCGYSFEKIGAARSSAASYLRAIAAGEYKQVVHAHWVKVDDGVMLGDGTHTECSNCHVWRKHMYSHCPSCAAVMDGKDDSHEVD